MTLAVAVHVEAAAELEAAAIWYDGQRDGLGLQFLAAVDRTVQHARAWPLTGALMEGISANLAVRRFPVTGFPYYVAYLIDADAVHVLAVAHAHRRPGYWRSRTSSG